MNVTVVPEPRDGSPFSTGPAGFPRRYFWVKVSPSRRTSATRLFDSALTTLAPTPCSPPATL